VIQAQLERSLSGMESGPVQFERHGYFVADRKGFNRSVTLRDSWANSRPANAPISRTTLDELKTIIRAAGGGANAIQYSEPLIEKLNRLDAARRYAPLLGRLRAARDPGDFRGRALEVNFADHFVRDAIALEYGIKQGMPGDIDFGWNVADVKLHIEMKLLGQDKATRDAINLQLEDRGVSATFVDDDLRDVGRLQADLILKASTTKFNPSPNSEVVNLVAIDVTELQLGTVDICDCLLAAVGNSGAAPHCDPSCLREPIVGAFETIAPERLKDSQKKWIASIQRMPAGAPHPKTYIHGAVFLFRKPAERAALSYDLSAVIVWNPTLMSAELAKRLSYEFHKVIPLHRQ
jgi:hypothetical protein